MEAYAVPPPSRPWPLEVTITPAQSSFFAGEELKCHITFTNHNIPVPASQPLPSTSRFPDDPRGSLSADDAVARRVVSAAPGAPAHGGHAKSQSFDMRKPKVENEAGPEKIGTLYDLDGNPLPVRKQRIGKNAMLLSTQQQEQITSRDSDSVRLYRGHAKSASMAVLPMPASHASQIGIGRPSAHVRRDIGEDESNEQMQAVSRQSSAAWSNIPPSPAPSNRADSRALRKPSAPIQRDHPHSRKKSVVQVQNEDLSASYELAHHQQTQPLNTDTIYTSDLNSSDVSLASPSDTSGVTRRADQPSSAESFYNLGGNETMDSVVRDRVTDWSQGGPHASSTANTTQSSGPPGSETVLWTFAQFGGSYEIDESLIKPAEFEDVKRRLAFGDSLASPAAPGTPRTMGGGDLGREDSTELPDATGWTSYLRSALGSSGGAGISDPNSRRRRHLRTGSTMLDARQKTMESKTIPLFATPPSIIAVDLTIPPGQSKTFAYSLKLPTDIPPSFFGKAIKFSYELVIGTNRIDRSRAAASMDHQRSRLIKVPLRVYNHVNITGAAPFFDLGNPIIVLKDQSQVQEVRPLSEAKAQTVPLDPERTAADARRKQANSVKGQRALTRYALSMLASCPAESDPKALDPPTDLEKAIKRLTSGQHGKDFSAAVGGLDDEFPETQVSDRRGSGVPGLSLMDDDGSQTCKGAVEILSRNSQKVSYDISKDGSIAAVLTLAKSRYRLGDTVLGVVTINQPRASARVVRVAAVLESHEEIEASLSTMLPHRVQRMTRKVHAEHHSSALDTGQSSFALPIPSGATPDFSTSGVKLQWTVRMSFLTQIAVLPATGSSEDAGAKAAAPHLVPCTDDGYGLYHSTYRASSNLAGHVHGTSARTKLEIVECAVPIAVLPNSTSFRAGAISFQA